jgi:AmiR/NasT family two-component response regulator
LEAARHSESSRNQLEIEVAALKAEVERLKEVNSAKSSQVNMWKSKYDEEKSQSTKAFNSWDKEKVSMNHARDLSKIEIAALNQNVTFFKRVSAGIFLFSILALFYLR